MTDQLVVTGFGPFGIAEANPSQAVVEHLSADPRGLPADTRFAVLDVEYCKVGQWLDALLADPPAALLLTGFSARATGLTLESRAFCEFAEDQPDNLGHVPPPGTGACFDNLHLDLPALANALQAEGFPAIVSSDAGRYLCNYSYRRALGAIAEEACAMRAIFVHLPAITGTSLAEKSAGAMPLEDMARGLALVARALVRGA